MQRNTLLALGLTLVTGASLAADRSIPVPPTIAMSWGYPIPGAKVNPHRTMAVGFWQRSSGAKAGVGSVFVSTLEYQLPEAASARVRSATFQFSGRPSQCVGAEPVVIDVYAYAADGKSAVSDASAGSRVAQLSADCTDKAAFARPIDVTAIVRQQAVASGVRFVGFNIRKANNRQGPGLFTLAAGKLSIVLADQAVAQPLIARSPGAVAPGAAVARAAIGPRHTEQPDIRSWVKGATATAPVLAPGALYRFERANYWGNHYQTIANATNPQACAQRCDEDSKCRVASFSGPGAPRPWANTCVLRHAIGPRHTEQPDIVSWVKP